MRDSSTKIPTVRCACGYEMDRASAAEGEAVPTAGDLTLCMECGRAYQFDAALNMRPLSDAEEAALPAENILELARVRLAIREVQRRQEPPAP